MNVVVVESPAKARTINKYLGPDYTVVASYGHVRDLPPKDGSVRPDSDFEMIWQVDKKAEKALANIAQALTGARRLYLATDPDREGEAISWHVLEVLKRRRALDDVEVKRIAFNEITRDAVIEAIKHPRELNRELIEAYLARRALDYLVGFSLSPVLWRKLPGSRSAGRVQSVALRLVCEREAEIEAFRPQEYWTIEADFRSEADDLFTTRLTHLDGRKLEKFDLENEPDARAAVDAVGAHLFTVDTIQRSTKNRNPQPPFTTSTLQQEAARKLRLSASRTMRIAQQLYEGVDIGGEMVGLITYMRTDSVQLSQQAIQACRHVIERRYGAEYLPKKPRIYRTKAKNAQEAHEAIRPTDVSRHPATVSDHLDHDQRRLYELIWNRTIACEMASAILDQVTVDVASHDSQVRLRAVGTTLVFDGFLKLYQEGRDDPSDADASESRTLPPLIEGGRLARQDVRPEQHFTQPPPRYTEASLVKRLEELGIGRPSTYASTLEILKAREYVRMEKRRFFPEDRGRLVTAFLTSFFDRYVQYNFTADMEDQLDDISGGRIDWKAVLRDFWAAFAPAVDETRQLSVANVIKALDEGLGEHFFPINGGGKDPRVCSGCSEGRLGLKLGKFGAFIGCSRYPDCRYTRPLAMVQDGDEPVAAVSDGDRTLGTDPETGNTVMLRKGPYGHYLQLGEGEDGEKPKRISLPKELDPTSVELALARKLLALPRQIGSHPEDGKTISAGIGRFGPYLRHDGRYKSLESLEDVVNIGLNRAVSLLKEPGTRRGSTPLREIGEHPEDGQPIVVMSGRYGPFVKHGKVNAPLPKDRNPAQISLDEAVELIRARKGRRTSRGRGQSKARRPANRRSTGTRGPAADPD